mmetsp:Transcript_76474/g.151306  ORF Transcript_76474/g.151306 Transcript_76474/m.151306 type:complete len:274 (+) Transcript_76474:107-928(+)|eukprot:CAMPEP_0172888714 /NCGR_PEP_ID=MMETSP1075-20121228/137088_1 /TAXON_ID=2916 /ORGANISM="Ceratium fusus, Strain PA161109" /LENGTH=273 /DNA_ID=CAMNT_0013742639 /DNA_START=52 /DNA_END=873 /DNA_ORIENTATION=-
MSAHEYEEKLLDGTGDLDSPFTCRELVKYMLFPRLLPPLWFIFPVVFVFAALRTLICCGELPSVQTWPALALFPLGYTVSMLAFYAVLLKPPQVLRERHPQSMTEFNDNSPLDPPKEKKAKTIYGIMEVLSRCFAAADGAKPFLDLGPFPMWGYGAGFVLMVLSFILMSWTLRVNKFNKPFAATVGFKQDGQYIIRDGPYSCVRHPFYAFLLPANVAYPLVLGSWLAVVPGLFAMAVLMWRTYQEEECLLEQFGEEYAEYQRQVRFRMFAGVF